MSGHDCNWVYDAANPSTKREFDLYNCGRYALDQWSGTGYVKNNQIGGTITAMTLNSAGQFYQRWPNNNVTYTASWDPAWWIVPC